MSGIYENTGALQPSGRYHKQSYSREIMGMCWPPLTGLDTERYADTNGHTMLTWYSSSTIVDVDAGGRTREWPDKIHMVERGFPFIAGTFPGNIRRFTSIFIGTYTAFFHPVLQISSSSITRGV